MTDTDIATVGDLIAALSQYDPTVPVRLPTQPRQPLADLPAPGACPPGDAAQESPPRTYRTRTGPVPGDLITVTDPVTGRAWRFIPDVTAPGDGWLLLDRCPGCDAEVPVTRVATLGDLGEYLDPDGDSPIADEARD